MTKCYRDKSEFNRELWPYAFAVMRYNVSYKGAMTIGANENGLYFSTMMIFRPGHPPLFIPWEDVTVKAKYVFFVQCTQFLFKKTPSVSIAVATKIAHELLAKSGRKW